MSTGLFSIHVTREPLNFLRHVAFLCLQEFHRYDQGSVISGFDVEITEEKNIPGFLKTPLFVIKIIIKNSRAIQINPPRDFG